MPAAEPIYFDFDAWLAKRGRMAPIVARYRAATNQNEYWSAIRDAWAEK